MKILTLLLIVFCIAVSCKSTIKEACTSEPEYINFAEKNEFEITEETFDCEFISLETTSESVFGHIYDLKIADNKIYIVADFDKVLVFDISGKFIKQLSKKGGGPGEYINPLKIHIDIDKNLISLADCRLKKMIHYNLDSHKYISSENTPNFSDCIRLPDGHIIWHSTSGYETGKRESFYLKITDADMQEKNMLCPAVFKSHYSVGAFHNFYQTDASAFFYHPQRPEIYKVTANTSNIDKITSFGEHNLPPLEWIKDKSSGNKNFTGALFGSGYISSFYLTETNKYIITTYAIVSSKKNYLGFYNKETKSSCEYEMHDFSKRTGLFMGYNIYGVCNDCVITSIPVSMLKNRNIKNPVLKSIINNSTEEDNPILCFFKWKSIISHKVAGLSGDVANAFLHPQIITR